LPCSLSRKQLLACLALDAHTMIAEAFAKPEVAAHVTDRCTNRGQWNLPLESLGIPRHRALKVALGCLVVLIAL